MTYRSVGCIAPMVRPQGSTSPLRPTQKHRPSPVTACREGRCLSASGGLMHAPVRFGRRFAPPLCPGSLGTFGSTRYASGSCAGGASPAQYRGYAVEARPARGKVHLPPCWPSSCSSWACSWSTPARSATLQIAAALRRHFRIPDVARDGVHERCATRCGDRADPPGRERVVGEA